MFSIPAVGLAKALVGVTISLHAAPAHHVPGHYTVKPGDTLSKVAHDVYGSRADWPALWWTNRHKMANPDAIVVGQRLRLSTWHPRKAWIERAAMAASAPVAPVPSSVLADAVQPARRHLVPVVLRRLVLRRRRELERHRCLRVRRQLEHQHRQRLLRRAPVLPGDLGRLRWRPVRLERGRSLPVAADRCGPAGARGPGHRCLAGLRCQRVTPPRRAPPACACVPGQGRPVTPFRQQGPAARAAGPC